MYSIHKWWNTPTITPKRRQEYGEQICKINAFFGTSLDFDSPEVKNALYQNHDDPHALTMALARMCKGTHRLTTRSLMQSIMYCKDNVWIQLFPFFETKGEDTTAYTVIHEGLDCSISATLPFTESLAKTFNNEIVMPYGRSVSCFHKLKNTKKDFFMS